MQNNFYFVNNFSNIYKKPSKLSEVTSQIIYGEKFKILSKNKNWIRIKMLFDNYVGYIKILNMSKNLILNIRSVVSKQEFSKNLALVQTIIFHLDQNYQLSKKIKIILKLKKISG